MHISEPCVCVFLVQLLVSSILAEAPQQAGDTNTVAKIRTAYSRLESTKSAVLKAASLQDRCALIVNSLRDELSDPAPEKRSNSYASNSEFLRLQYLDQLSALGQEAVEDLRSLSLSHSGALKNFLYVARARIGDESVYVDLIDAIANDTDPFLRAMGVRSLGRLGKKDAVPLLKQLLNDPYYREYKDSFGSHRIYLIREEAARSLIQLGMQVQRTNDSFNVIGSGQSQ